MNLKTFLVRNQTIAAILLASICGCAHGEVPRWEGKLYAGDSKRAGVSRAQDPDPATNFIPANDPRFDRGLWMTYADFRSFYATYVLGCKQWRRGIPMMGTVESLDRFKIVVDQMQWGSE